MIHNLADYSVHRLEKVNKNSAVAFICISPFEVHGYHLPYGQDIFMAEEQAKIIAEELKFYNYEAYKYPTIPFGADVFDAKYGYQVSVLTVRDLLLHAIKVVEHLGFKKIVICNGHGGPAHMIGIHSAVKFAQKRNLQCYSSFHVFVEKVIKEDLHIDGVAIRKDLHAGLAETSIALASYPQKVDEDYRRYKFPKLKEHNLYEKFIIKFILPILQKVDSHMGFPFSKDMWAELVDWHFEKNQSPYIGYPNLASKKNGEMIIDMLREEMKEKIVKPLVR